MKITLKKVTGKPVIKEVTETMTVRIEKIYSNLHCIGTAAERIYIR